MAEMAARDPDHAERYRAAWLRLVAPDLDRGPFELLGPRLLPVRWPQAIEAIRFSPVDPVVARARTILLTRGHDLLLSFPSASGVALSLRYRDGEIVADEPCLTFFVAEKLPGDLLGNRAIPGEIAGIPTDVVESGKPDLHVPPGHAQGTRLRPLQPGGSICHMQLSSGTLGCFVEDAAGTTYVLSCAHVLCDHTWHTGDSIVQPGPRYGGATPADTIAHLDRWLPLLSGPSQADAAIAAIAPGTKLTAAIRYIGVRPSGTRTLTGVGMLVQKSGDATGLTHGITTGIHATIGPYGVNGVNGIYFTDTIVTSAMSLPGDSGSLLMDYQGQAIGLLFGGLRFPGSASPGGYVTSWFHPIEPVLHWVGGASGTVRGGGTGHAVPPARRVVPEELSGDEEGGL